MILYANLLLNVFLFVELKQVPFKNHWQWNSWNRFNTELELCSRFLCMVYSWFLRVILGHNHHSFKPLCSGYLSYFDDNLGVKLNSWLWQRLIRRACLRTLNFFTNWSRSVTLLSADPCMCCLAFCVVMRTTLTDWLTMELIIK